MAGDCDCVQPALRAKSHPVESLLTQTRKAKGLSLEAVAKQIGTDQANLSRVERGLQTPKRELARKLFHYYRGKIPVGAIYDPELHTQGLKTPAA